MNTVTLDRIARADAKIKIDFGGVLPKNLLPLSRGRFKSFILNTDPSYRRGQHWQSVHFDNRRHASFFCSYGTAPTGVVKKFILENSDTFSYNSIRVQHRMTTSCGLFCLFFLWHKTRGIPITQLRTRDPCANERLIRQFTRLHFKLLPNPGELGSTQFC